VEFIGREPRLRRRSWLDETEADNSQAEGAFADLATSGRVSRSRVFGFDQAV
jgi:hypothetical protein